MSQLWLISLKIMVSTKFFSDLGVSKIMERVNKKNHVRINQSTFHYDQCADRRHDSEKKMAWKQDLCGLSPTVFSEGYTKSSVNQRNWRRIIFIKLVLHSICSKICIILSIYLPYCHWFSRHQTALQHVNRISQKLKL